MRLDSTRSQTFSSGQSMKILARSWRVAFTDRLTKKKKTLPLSIVQALKNSALFNLRKELLFGGQGFKISE